MRLILFFCFTLAIVSMTQAKLGGTEQKRVEENEQPQRRLLELKSYGATPPSSRFPLGECEGDCDSNDECGLGLQCFQRGKFDRVPPGCSGNDNSRTDYCIRDNISEESTPAPVSPYISEPTPGPVNPPFSQPTPAAAPFSQPTPAADTALSNFRLKLYWQQGYFWQEETFEREFCMKCRNGGCYLGNKIYISKCGGNSQRFDFVTVDDDEVLIKLHGDNLCFERVNKDILMSRCDVSNSRQQWYANEGGFAGDRFEFSQYGLNGWCITQRHHPKEDEEVELEPCGQARNGETSYWNRY
jgi:hypothetical protein